MFTMYCTQKRESIGINLSMSNTRETNTYGIEKISATKIINLLSMEQ